MFATAATAISKRAMSTTGAGAGKKVAVLGASGGIGQPLSLLLKLSPEVGELSCYDVVGTPGVAADLSHVSLLSDPRRALPTADPLDSSLE
jgi:malate dehydrogenase